MWWLIDLYVPGPVLLSSIAGPPCFGWLAMRPEVQRMVPCVGVLCACRHWQLCTTFMYMHPRSIAAVVLSLLLVTYCVS